jgi:hypothetical protein
MGSGLNRLFLRAIPAHSDMSDSPYFRVYQFETGSVDSSVDISTFEEDFKSRFLIVLFFGGLS